MLSEVFSIKDYLPLRGRWQLLVFFFLALTGVTYAQTVATPVLSEASTASSVQFNVTVTDSTPGATLYYTTDGSTPTTSSSSLASGGSLLISQSEILKVIAVASGYTDSAVASATYTITGGVALGMYHSTFLKNDGTVWTCGLNTSGQLGDGTYTLRGSPVQVSGLSGIVAVASGWYHTVALKNDGTVWAWGINSNGELGDGTTTLRNTPAQVKKSNGSGGSTPLTNIVAISAGAYHNLALDSSGNVWAWGLDSSGQLGDNATTQENLAEQLTTLGGASAIQIIAGSYHSLVLTTTGAVLAWGLNSSGQLGDGTTTQRNSPVSVSGISGSVNELAAGEYVSFALQSDGTVWGWGAGGGYTGDGTSTQRNSPVHLSTISNVTEIASGVSGSLAIKNDGTVWSWGINNYGERGDGTISGTPLSPAQMTGISGAVVIAAGNSTSVILKNDGTVWVCGYNIDTQLGNGDSAQLLNTVQVPTSDTYVGMSANAGHEIFLKGDGTVWGVGDNLYGDNGDGTTLVRKTPVQVAGLTNVQAVSAGNYFGLALKNDGTIWGWGWNSFTLGDGTYTNRYTPVQTGVGISGFNNMTSVIAGYTEAYSIKNDGTLWGWGDNGHGQMGDGTTTSYLHPAQLTSISGITALEVGTSHNILALKSDGTVWAWGANNYGQLGDGTTTERHSPVQVKLSDGVTSLTNIVAIRAANGYCMALDSSGNVWSWGENINGELGDGTTTERNNLVELTGISEVKSLFGEKCAVTFAFKNDGTTWAWGPNFHGDFGIGTATGSKTPIQLTNLAGVTSIIGSGANTLMLKEDGHVQGAGWDLDGQLGTCLYAIPFADPGFNVLAGTALPTVSITAPANNATLILGHTETFTASASESGGTIANVSYYIDSNLIGTSTSSGSSYSITWTPSTWGSYTFTAIATDTNGHTSFRSSPVTVVVPYDSDSNGLPDWWELKYFGHLSNSASSIPNGNGLTLLQDYQEGNDPANYYSQGGTTITPTISIVSGNSQTDAPGEYTTLPLIVSVTNSVGGAALSGAPVTFTVATGGGQISATSGGSLTTSLSVTTDGSGHAQIYYKYPSGYNVTSTITATTAAAAVTFSEETSSPYGPPPQITSAATVSASVGVPLSYAITATNAPTVFVASGLPSGLSIDTATGIISGTPAATGIFSIALSATNSVGTGTGILVLQVISNSVNPIINSPTAMVALSGSTVAYQITASHSPTLFGASGLPSGLIINPTTGAISGTASTPGTYTVNLTAGNEAGTGTSVLSLVIVSASPTEVQIPVITSSLTGSATQGTSYSYTITATNSPTGYGAAGLPEGLSIDGSTGVISGASTNYGDYSIPIIATNSQGTGAAILELNIAPAPVLTSSGTVTIPLNQSFSYQATSSLIGQVWSATGLPGWLSLDANTGILSGTPTASGSATITLTGSIPGVEATGTLTIIASGLPTLSGSMTADAYLQTPFFYYISALNPATGFSASPLPSGLSLDTDTGLISGMPDTTGTYTVTLTTTNTEGISTGTLVIKVTFGNQAVPTITSTPTASGTESQAFSYTITANNSPTSYSISGNPSWLSCNTSTGALSGTPPSSQAFTINVNATGAEGTATAPVEVIISSTTAHSFTQVFQTGVSPASAYNVLWANISDGGSNPFYYMEVGSDGTYRYRALLSFDLSALPADATITSANLMLMAEDYSYSVPAGISSILDLYEASNLFNPTTANWTSNSAYDTLLLSSLTATTTAATTAETWTSSTNFVAAVQNAVDIQSPLDLTILSSAAEATLAAGQRFAFYKDNSLSGAAPKLTISYDSALPPVISSSTSGTIIVSSSNPWSPDLSYSNVDGSTTYSGSGVAGLSVNSSTGAIMGTPTASGTYVVTATNSNGVGTLTYTFNVGNVPTITSTTTITGTYNTSLSYTITASNSPTVYEIIGGGLPAGLMLDPSTGVISGTPVVSNSVISDESDVTLGAINAYGTGTADLSIIIPLPAPVISAPLPALVGNQGVAFNYTIPSNIQAYPYDDSFAFDSALTSALTAIGLSVDYHGNITGTPTASGTFFGTVTASSDPGTSTAVPISLSIIPLPAPVIQSQVFYLVEGYAPTSAIVQASVEVAAQSNGYPDPSMPASFSSSDLAGYGLSINSYYGNYGIITGTGTTGLSSGVYYPTVTATNVAGIQGTGTITLVLYSTGPGILGPSALPWTDTATVGQSYSYTLNTVPGAPTATSTSATGLPPGLAYTNRGTSGTIDGIPSVAGTYTVTLSATDSFSNVSTATMALTVKAGDPSAFLLEFQEAVNPTTSYAVPSVTIVDDAANPVVDGETFNSTGTDLPVGLIFSPADMTAKARSRALLAFDLSALPPNAVITDVSLVMSPTTTGSTGTTTLSVQVQQIGSFDPASACWNLDSYQYSDILASQAVNPSSPTGYVVFASTPAFKTAVQQACYNSSGLYLSLSSPAAEAGATLSSIGFATRAINPQQNPRLVVTYTVGSPTSAPVISSATVYHGTVNVPVSYTITANHSPTSFAVTGLPSPLTLSSTTGAIMGTVTTVGSTIATVSASNTFGTGSQQVTFNIDSATQSDALSANAGSNNQVGLPGAFLASALSVHATVSGTFVPDTLVTFTVHTGGGAFSATNTGTATATILTVPTNGSGDANVYFRLPTTAQTSIITVTAGTATPLKLSETAALLDPSLSGSLTILSVADGDGQTGGAGVTLPDPVTIQAANSLGQAAPGISITFTPAHGAVSATSGGTFSSSASITTDSNGLASVYWQPSGGTGDDTDHIVCSTSSATSITLNAVVQSGGSVTLPTPGGGTSPVVDGDPLPTTPVPPNFTLSVVEKPVTAPTLPDATKVQLQAGVLPGIDSFVALKRIDQNGEWVILGTCSPLTIGTDNYESCADSGLVAGHDYQYQVEAIKDGYVVATTNIQSYDVPLIKGFYQTTSSFSSGNGTNFGDPDLGTFTTFYLSDYFYDYLPNGSPWSGFAEGGTPGASNGTSWGWVNPPDDTVYWGTGGWSAVTFQIDFNPTDTSLVPNLNWVQVHSIGPFFIPSSGASAPTTSDYKQISTPVVSGGRSGGSWTWYPSMPNTNYSESFGFGLAPKLAVSDGHGGTYSDADASYGNGIVLSAGGSAYLSPPEYLTGLTELTNVGATTLDYSGPIQVYNGSVYLPPGSTITSYYNLTVTADDNAGDGSTAPITISNTVTGSSTVYFKIHNTADLSMPIDEASGPRYRKIALNGLPLPDEKPQQSGETDQEKEETYIDALTDGLRHSTTDVYMPVSGSDLTVSARRDFRSQVWTPRNGLRPHEQPDLPFGPCWSSNLAPNIRFVTGNDPSRTTPDQAIVTDETGAVHTFVLWYDPSGSGRKFFPMPTAKNEQQVPNLESLAINTNTSPVTYTFTRKYGTTLTYQDTALSLSTDEDRSKGSLYDTTNTYARLIQAQDRVGNVVNYQYVGNTNLVPATITVANQPDIKLSIEQQTFAQSSGPPQSLITAIWDAKGNKTAFGYTPFNTATSTSGEDYAYVLTSVTTPDGAVTNYGYSAASENDPALHPPGDPGTTYWYADIASITDPLGNTYAFTYNLDDSKHTYVNNSLQKGYIVQIGSPRNIATVVLPGSGGTTVFDTNNSNVHVEGSGTTFSLVGSRSLSVTDAALQLTRTYRFGNAAVVPVPKIPGPGGAGTSFTKIIAYQTLSIDYGTGASLGTETFQFNLNAGMALSSITDLSGNTTSFTQGDMWTATGDYAYFQTLTGLSLVGYYDDPTSQTDALGKSKTFTYFGPQRIMQSSTDENGNKTCYDIDSLGRRTSEKLYDPSSTLVQETDFSYANQNYPGFMTKKCVKALGGSDPSWVKPLITTYVPDADGRVAQEIVDPNGLDLVTSYTYDANGNKLSATDPKGHTTWFSYDSRNRLVTTTFADGSQKQMVYDERGNKTKEYDENGIATLYSYDALNRVTSQARDMNGNGAIDSGTDLVTSYTYNAVNSKLTTTDPNGGVTSMAYDGLQRVTSITDALSNITTFAYGANAGGNAFDSASFKPTHTVDPRGFTTDVTYDALYRPLTKLAQYDPAQTPSPSSTVYDNVGNPVTVTDPLGHQTTTTYDALNRPLVITAADGSTAQNFYTSTGFKWKVVDPDGHATQTAYDTAGRPVCVRQPAYDDGSGIQSSPISKTIYDAAGNVVETVNPLGNKWDYVFDARNRKVQEIEPAVTDKDLNSPAYNTSTRPTLNWQYDAAGRVIAVIDARGNQATTPYKTTTTYDAANRPIEVDQPTVTAGTPKTFTTYDKNGNVLTVTDPNSHVTTNTYDALNRLLTTTDAAGDVVTNTYDAVGNKLTVKDGLNQTTSFAYDGLNRNLSITDAAGHATQLRYDAMNKTQRIDALGQTTTYLYDVRNRLQHVVYASTAAANSQRNYCYDAVGNLLSVTEPAKTAANVVYGYDELNRVKAETSQGKTHHYVYDAAGNRLSTTYGGTSRTLVSTYDALNRLLTLTESGTRVSSYDYDVNGNIVQKTAPNGDTEAYCYDELNRCTIEASQTGGAAALFTYLYGYDLDGNVLTINESYPSGLSNRLTTNTYDAINRLTVEAVTGSAPNSSTTYTYDAGNNCSSAVVTGTGAGEADYTYNNLNQMTAVTVGGVTETIAYDLNGNCVSDSGGAGTQSYSYDFENRLIGVTAGTNVYAYTYDYRTRRIVRDESGAGGTITNIVFSGGTSVQEYDGSTPTLSVEYIRGSDYGGGVGGILYTVRSGTPSYTHENKRGDVVAKTDGSGSLIWQGQYNASGKQVATTGSTLDRQGPNTKDQDGWGGINEGQRYSLIRGKIRLFLTRDPAGFVDGPNLYCYVRQNPWSSFDAEGLLTMMLNGQEVPWTISNQAQAFVQNVKSFYVQPVVENVKNDATLAHEGAVVATSSKTTVTQKVEGAAVAVAAVVDVGTMVTPEGGAESTVGHSMAGGAVKGAIEGSAKETVAKDVTYITYALKDSDGNVKYVGRASGQGAPEQVLKDRLAKGHDVYDNNPGLTPEVIGTQSNAASNKGAEGVAYDYYKQEGAQLLNDVKSPPVSEKTSKTASAQAKYQAFQDDPKGSVKLEPQNNKQQ